MLHRSTFGLVPLSVLFCSHAFAAGGAAPSGSVRYLVANLPAPGSSAASGNSIDNLGLIAGFTAHDTDAAWHATAWLYGLRFDLGTLGGPHSNVAWPVKNDIGLIAGIAQTNVPEPNGARWSCRSFFPPPLNVGYTCLGFAWQGGAMRALPTLGGHNGFATGANNRRQIAGWTENAVRDPTCVAPYQVLQFRPVLWGPRRNELRELPLLAGDSSGAATALNDRGQAVGISGICDRAVGRYTAAHAVLWEAGNVTDIGNLGGVAWNTPMAINEHGEAVGFSNISAAAGGAFQPHAFHWSREAGLRDLGTLPGDAYSQALGLNDRGQIVGQSCDADFAACRAVLWQDGAAIDLNTRLAGRYGDQLIVAQDINDFGQISGQALDPDDGSTAAFRAAPIPFFAAAAAERAADAMRPTPMPPRVRQALLERYGVEELDLVK